MFEYVFINGKYSLKSKASIPVGDVGFLYGDGLFETFRSYNGKIPTLDRHLNRLLLSLKSLKYNLGFDISYLRDEIFKLIEKNKLKFKDAYIKVIVTRNAYKNKFKFDYWIKPNLIIIARSFIPYPTYFYKSGIKIVSSSIKRSKLGNELYKYKMLNYFENVFAKNEAYINNAQEAFFLSSDKVVLEGAVSNIFCIKNDKIFTTPITLNILPGITREIVIEVCKQKNLKFSEKRLHYFNLLEADEVFITNSLMGIMPVRQIDNYVIENDIPGKITEKISKFYSEIIESN